MKFLLLNDQHHAFFAKSWRQFLVIGLLLSLIGLFAIVAATSSTLITVAMLGIILFISGFLIFVDAFISWRKKWSSFFLHVLVSFLYMYVGWMLVHNPTEAAMSLTLLLGIFYLIAGVFRILVSSAIQAPLWGWGWLNGAVTLILGVLILTHWPESSLFIIGLFVGIDLLFCGWAYIMSAFAARRLGNP